MASFSLRPSSPPWTRFLPAWACVALGLAAGLVLAVDLTGVPGLHADEAWVGLRADELARGGAWSWFGMRDHAGPLHALLVAAGFAAWGPSAWALRAVGVLTNAGAVACYAWVTGQLFGRRTAVLSTALLVSAPAFWLSARTATEHAALSALLACAAVACLLRGRQPPTLHPAGRNPAVPRTWALAAGALLGLGTWNHLVFVAVPATLAAFAAVSWGLGALRRPEVLWTAFGWACVEVGPLTHLGGRLKLHGGQGGALLRVAQVPRLLGEMFRGDVVALRVVGRVATTQLAWAPVLLALCATTLVAAAFDVGGRARRARLVLGAAVGLSAMTAVVVPAQAERYLLLPALVLPWVVCEGLAAACALAGTRGPALATAACLAVVGGQVAFGYANVVAPLREGGAVATRYRFGGEEETSAHVLDTAALYDALVAREVTRVAAHHFIAAPLRFYDLPHHKLTVEELPFGREHLAETLAQILTRPEYAAGEVPVLTYQDEWPALQQHLDRDASARGLQRASAEVAALGPFALVRQSGAANDATADAERP